MSATDAGITPSIEEHQCRAAGTVVFRESSIQTGNVRRDWIRAFAGIDPSMPEAEIRRELKRQNEPPVLGDQSSTGEVAGVSLDCVTTPEDPPGWIGSFEMGTSHVEFHFHDTDPAVWLTIGEEAKDHLRGWLRQEGTRVDPVSTFNDTIEPVICNSGLQQIPHYEAGFTSNPFVLSDEVDRTDCGELRNLGRLIYFESYQTRCPIEALAEDGRVRLEIKA